MMHRAKMFILIALFVLTQVALYECQPPRVVECDTLDIREFTDLPLLNNCTVVMGNLDIILWSESITEKYTSEEINLVSFPNLREITGFLFLHSMKHLKSLGSLFPNLTLIRGERLFSHYALVIYDMSELEEVSLRNCERIVNLHSSFEKIDWGRIIRNGHIYIGSNAAKSCKPSRSSLCVGCLLPKLCWNHRYCQRSDESYYVKGRKVCHVSCLGQCVNETANGCFTCSGISEDQRCVDECTPARLLNTETKRCITTERCLDLKKKVYNDKCVAACPPGYSTDTVATKSEHDVVSGNVCKVCVTKCPKVCFINEPIKYISHLEALGPGCSIINGSLEINLLTDVMNVTHDLITYLGDIEEIWGNLKIYRSIAITSLSFLNNLKYIQGSNSNANNFFSIRIFENHNLQSLMDWNVRSKRLILDHNSMQFHNNRALCVQEINKLRDNTIYNDHDSKAKDMFENNGFRRFCHNDNINTKFEVLSTSECQVYWKEKTSSTVKMNASFVIYYIISPTAEIEPSLFFERDACSSYSWKSIYLKRENLILKNGYLSHVITDLEQFENYAFFIQTYMNEDVVESPEQANTRNGQSKVRVFRTLMDVPSRVYNLTAVNSTETSMTLNWNVHSNEVDAIEYFYINIIVQPDHVELLDKRNYCINPIEQAEFDEADGIEPAKETNDQDHDIPWSEDCCEFCPQHHQRPHHHPPELTRRKRDVNDFESILDEEVNKGKSREESSRSKRSITDYIHYVGRRNITGHQRAYTIEGLKPFTQYALQFFSCTFQKCSDYEMLTNRTLPSSDYDQLMLVPISYVVYGDQIALHFDEPARKNGAIIHYIIEYRSGDVNLTAHWKPETICITRRQHELSKYVYHFVGMQAGFYHIRVKAVSIAGQGPFTDWHMYELINSSEDTITSWVMGSAALFLLFISVVTYLVYNRHKIFIADENDRVMLLMNEIGPTDFHEISLRYDQESDNTEE
ncbi:unnamed protein product [Diamesa serratosioi]